MKNQFLILSILISMFYNVACADFSDATRANFSERNFKEVLAIIKKDSPVKLSNDDIYRAAIEGILNQVNNKLYPDRKYKTSFNTLLKKAVAKEINIGIKGELSGIGLVLKDHTETSGYPEVLRTIKGGGAEKNIKEGDLILRVDNRSIKEMSFQEMIYKIRGKTGSKINITLLRNGQILNKKIERKKINIPSIKFAIKNKRIGKLKIKVFHSKTPEQIKTVLIEMKKKKIKKLVIDLRNNAGGKLTAVKKALELFVDKGKTLYQLENCRGKNVVKSSGSPLHKFSKIIVLVNRYTTSGGEIFTNALKKTLNATIAGENTYGKATAEKIVNLTNGEPMKYTTSKILRADSTSWIEKGIIPDVKLPMLSTEEKHDYALEVAFNLAS